MRFSAKAFSLLEISFVLMIIGIFLFGGLKGWDLVQKARLYRLVGDLNMYRDAVLTFKDEYGDYPGSFDRPVFDVSGDGSGILNGSSFDENSNAAKFWIHLKQSRLAFVPNNGPPKTPLGGFYTVCSLNNANYILVGSRVENSENALGGVLTPHQVSIIKDKFNEDDFIIKNAENSREECITAGEINNRNKSACCVIYLKIL